MNPHQTGRARWTVLIYMNAANNLQPDSLTNMAQILSVGSDANLNIVVQWKQANCADCGNPTFVGTRRYLVHRGDFTTLDQDRLPDPATNVNGTSDMGDWHVLQNFVQWGYQNFPADHLAVVIWDHGSGWEPTRSAGNRLKLRFRAVSQDDEFNTEIETEQIPQALAGVPVDTLIFDASLEQMVEVAYQVRNSAHVMIGSEESPPGEGYPYDAWLGALKSSSGVLNPCQVGEEIVRDFVAAYPNNSNITQSVVDLTKMDNVATALNNFANTLRLHIHDQADLLSNARERAQNYAYPENKDLFDYAEILRTSTASPIDIKQAAANMETALINGSSGAVITSSHGNIDQTGSHGLAIYIPGFDIAGQPLYLSAYNNLALARSTNWDEFLQAQVK